MVKYEMLLEADNGKIFKYFVTGTGIAEHLAEAARKAKALTEAENVTYKFKAMRQINEETTADS